MARNPLFRATALERLSAPEQLDERMQVVPPRSWLAFAALAGLLLAAGAWSVLARLPVRVSGEGVFQPARPGAAREVTAFIRADEARLVRPGLPVRIRLSNAHDLIGEVTQIAAQTTPRAHLLQALDHEPTVDRLTRQGPIVSVSVALPVSAAATAESPAGARCQVDIVIGETRPASLLFGR